MVANSTVEGHDKTELSSSSSSSSSSSLSSSSLSSSSPLARHELALSPQRTESEQLQRRAAPGPNPRSVSVPSVYLTHFPTFSSKEDCKIITDTASKLERSAFYWGPLGVEDAHCMLRDAPLGSFLIRDSRQKDVFFTLSYHGSSGPVSVRIDYKQQKFSLAGNERSFPTLFALLEHYINSPKKRLSVPYRKWEPTLQERCRKRVMELCGGGSRVSELPVTHVVQHFLMEFPYKL
ncbi:suppressor of cytokine signaling 1a [Cottoperca gobio]|uniref:Suppressor of cytokine signaling 1a n=1 Tax=Cottoperca gobio TaxID=56716 RepID=A0A6J2Q5F4_COTGO|nr:suppressor of cytokine signaling 1 [Cottoperca gobio]